MARLLSQTLIRNSASSSSPTFLSGSSQATSLSSRIFTQRNRSNQPGKAQLVEVDLESDTEVEVLGIRKLEDVIHSIIVKRSAPDWLPFRPGSSYWVPPRPRRPFSVVDLFGQLANQLTDDETMSFATVHGWPSSAYLFHGSASTNPVPLEVEIEVTDENSSDDATQSEGEEG